MSIYVWISSVCLSARGIEYLEEAIKSCLALNVRRSLQIILSIFTDQDLSSVKELLNSCDHQIFIRDEKLSQFEHIETLSKELQLNDDDWIIFLDDDDLFLENTFDHLSEEINGYVGYQYIPENHGYIIDGSINLTFSGAKNFIELIENLMMKVCDFSGTTLRFKYVKEFFKQRKVKKRDLDDVLDKWFHDSSESLSDIKFMKFIEKKVPNVISLKSLNVKPFVFHRLKDNPSIWMNNLSEGLPLIEELLGSYQSIIKEMKE